jgi:hypothetical protein
MDEVTKLKSRYAQQIEDGRRIEVFTSMPEWQWYIEHVVKPTLQDYTNRIMTGVIQSDKEDWILRGMIMGMKMVIDTPDQFKKIGDHAKVKAKELKEYIDE